MGPILHQQSDTTHPIPFTLVLSSDHVTGATGKTATIKISKNGGSALTPTGTAAEISAGDMPGEYKFAPSAGDVGTLGSLKMYITAADCDPVSLTLIVVPFDPYILIEDAVWTRSDRTLTAITSTNVSQQQYSNFLIVKGNSYSATARDLTWTKRADIEWPTDLSEWTWTFSTSRHPDNGNPGSDTITGTVTVVTATGSSRKLRLAMTAAVTAALATGQYRFALRGTKSSEIWDVVKGIVTVED